MQVLFPFILMTVVFGANGQSGIRVPGKTVHTPVGSIQGIVSRSRLRREFYSWLGIPYARPPVGELRFASPVPYGKLNGVLHAKSFGPRCAQYDNFQDLILGSEDCLKLNVFVPKKLFDNAGRHAKLPVMVYLHGGGYMIGSAPDYRADYFMDEDIVLVTLQYRLNALGFLNTNDGVVRGNMGLKDQVLALKWVHDNIDCFGGDKYRVTLIGESAGAMSTHLHMLSPMSRGLFHKAISQSGTALSPFTLNTDPEKQAIQFAEQLGCLHKSSVKTVRCLRKKPLIDILKVHQRAPIWFSPDHRQLENLFVPSVEAVCDGEAFLCNDPEELLQQGKFAEIPWLAGVNSADGLIWMIPYIINSTFRYELDRNWDEVVINELFLHGNQQYDTKAIRDYYISPHTDLTTLDGLPEYLLAITDRWFSVPLYKSINYHARQAPVYAYYYNKIGPSFFDLFINLGDRLPHVLGFVVARARDWYRTYVMGLPRERIGASHSDELLMQFPYAPIYTISPTNPDFTFSREFIRTWVQFATNETNLTFKDYIFPPVTNLEDPVMFELNDEPNLIQLHLKPRAEFWDHITNANS